MHRPAPKERKAIQTLSYKYINVDILMDVDRSIALDLLEDTRGASCPLEMEREHHSEHEVPLNVEGRAEQSARTDDPGAH